MCDIPFNADRLAACEQPMVPRRNALRHMIGNAFHRWQKARDHKRLRQQPDECVLADIGLTNLPTAMDRVSSVAVELLGAPTYKENNPC